MRWTGNGKEHANYDLSFRIWGLGCRASESPEEIRYC